MSYEMTPRGPQRADYLAPNPYPISGSAAYYGPPAPDPGAGGALSGLKRLLYGRRWLLIGLVGAGLVAGGVLGWILPDTVYKSDGQIWLDPSGATDGGRASGSRLENYIEAQLVLLRGDKVLMDAMESDSWRRLNRPMTEEGIEQFRDSLSIVRPKRGEHIYISFVDRDPQAAQIAVGAVIAAYRDAAQEFNSQKATEQLSVVEQQHLAANSELENTRVEMVRVVEEFGGIEGLRRQHAMWQSEYLEQDVRIRQMDREIELLDLAAARAEEAAAASREAGEASGEGGETSGEPETPVVAPDLTAEEIHSRGDPAMADLFFQRSELEARLAKLKEDGLMDNHVLVAPVRSQLDLVAHRIEEARRLYNLGRGIRTTGPGGRVVLAEQRQVAILMRDDALARTRELSSFLREYDHLDARRQSLEEQTAELQSREERLIAERDRKGRIHVLSQGRLPTSPHQDDRIFSAVKGGFGGGFLGFLILLLIALLDRRIRRHTDASGRLPTVRLLGLVPDLPAEGADDETMERTAHCINQVRTVLEIGRKGESNSVWCITGPTPGTGKSTVTMALGLSFAAAGSRTLLIDCDFTGRGLSRQVRNLLGGRVQRALKEREALPAGAPTGEAAGARALIDAMNLARNGSGESAAAELERLAKLIDRGSAARLESLNGTMESAALLARMVAAGSPAESRGANYRDKIQGFLRKTGAEPGALGDGDLKSVLEGGDLPASCAPTGVPNLWHLPLGGVSSDQAGQVSFAKLSRMIEAARGRFDVVLVDTGPVPGSLEAGMVATLADGTVFVVARGDDKANALAAFHQLASMGAVFAGFVFNRAESREVILRSRSHPVSRRIAVDVGA